jgi:hypothetical protein
MSAVLIASAMSGACGWALPPAISVIPEVGVGEYLIRIYDGSTSRQWLIPTGGQSQFLLIRGQRLSGPADLLDPETCAVLATAQLPDARDIALSFRSTAYTGSDGYAVSAERWNDSEMADAPWPQTGVCGT